MRSLNEHLNEGNSKKDKIVDKFLSKYPKENIKKLWDDDYDFKKVMYKLSSQGIDLEVVDHDSYYYINFWDLDYDAPDGLIKQIEM
jgi:hypothetical protein